MLDTEDLQESSPVFPKTLFISSTNLEVGKRRKMERQQLINCSTKSKVIIQRCMQIKRSKDWCKVNWSPFFVLICCILVHSHNILCAWHETISHTCRQLVLAHATSSPASNSCVCTQSNLTVAFHPNLLHTATYSNWCIFRSIVFQNKTQTEKRK